MTKVITASQARSDIYNLIDETAQNHEPIIITGKRNKVVMVSQEDWNVIQDMRNQKISNQNFNTLSQ